MADDFNSLRPEIKNYKAEADADLIPIPGQLELHGICRYGVRQSPCFGALFVADLIAGMEEIELHCRRRGTYNLRKVKIATISVRMVMRRFPSWKSPGKQPFLEKRGVKRFLRLDFLILTSWGDLGSNSGQIQVKKGVKVGSGEWCLGGGHPDRSGSVAPLNSCNPNPIIREAKTAQTLRFTSDQPEGPRRAPGRKCRKSAPRSAFGDLVGSAGKSAEKLPKKFSKC